MSLQTPSGGIIPVRNCAYAYDALNRVTSMEAIKNNGVWQQWFSQQYDANGNITGKSESTGLYSTT